MGPLKLERAEQGESCMSTQTREQASQEKGTLLSHAQVEGYRGLPFRCDVTGYPLHLSGPMDRYKLPQNSRHSSLRPGTVPSVEGAK